MFEQRICPFCQNVVRLTEVDGKAYGRCIECGVIYTDDITKGMPVKEGEWDIVNDGYRGEYLYTDDLGRDIYHVVGTFKTLDEAERAVTSRTKRGCKCNVWYQGSIISYWVDGERPDLQRKHIRVEFSYTDGSKKDGTSEIITTMDQPNYKAIEYYLLKREFRVNKYTVTDDYGNVIEEVSA